MTVLLLCAFLIQGLVQAISEPNQSRESRYHLVPFLSLVRGSPVAVAGPHTGIELEQKIAAVADTSHRALSIFI